MSELEKQIAQLAERLAGKLQQQSMTLAVAESCTGGWLAKVLTDLSGSSAWFLGGVVSYSNAAKHNVLRVECDCLDKYGAVSEPVAKQMVAGVGALFSSSLAVSITGVAGPSGGTLEKPVGMVCFAVINETGNVSVVTKQFAGDRQQVRLQAVVAALQLLLDEMGD